MNSLDANALGKSQDTPHDLPPENHLLHEIRVGCTAGAPITPLPAEESQIDEYLNAVEATGILLQEGTSPERERELIEWASRVLIHTFDPQDPQALFERCRIYTNAHGRSNEENTLLGGPGMITILRSLDDLAALDTAKQDAMHKLTGAKYDQLLKQAIAQPVIARVRPKEVVTLNLQHLKQEQKVTGFIFRNARSIRRFKRRWEKEGSAADEIPPFVFFEGTPDEIQDFFQHGHCCDGYICTQALDPSSAHAIRNERIDLIANAHNQALFNEVNPHEIRVGVAALQGAYHLERALVQSLASEIPEYEIRAVLVHTRSELQNLDAIVLGGGWHSPQLRMYRDPRIDIIEGVREHIQRGKDVFLACAGAILGRNPHKHADGCSSDEPANFIDVTVKNNRINGPQPVKLCQNGGWGEPRLIGHFSAGPAFELLGDNVHSFAKLADDTVVGVEEKKGDATIIAVSAHNRAFVLRLLHAIIAKRWQQRSEAIRD